MQEVMTGRDLIIYILSNGLEDEPIYKDGKILGFMTEEEAASKFEVGIATLRVWANQGLLHSVKIGDKLYIPQNAENPKKLLNHTEDTKSNEKSSTNVSGNANGSNDIFDRPRTGGRKWSHSR